jgi:ubiquinone/menaquinone biosynthesis C-methylase UbiE
MDMQVLGNLDVEDAVRQRYSAGAQAREAALCCPVSYDPTYLKVIPQEVLDRDYGCGDPSRYLKAGETVLDLGSGGGKIAFIASQIVGAAGSVIGVDMNDDMLALARGAQGQVAKAIGHSNVAFLKGRIQDLALDLSKVEAWLTAHPVRDLDSLERLQSELRRLRQEQPLVASESVDVVVSNCVLNLVGQEEKAELFRELYRVLKRGGRAVISDIVSSREVPEDLRQDPELWSGCISGAFEEEAFLAAFEQAGFHGMVLEKRDATPWQEVAGIEFRSVTVIAYKGKSGPCRDEGQALIYRGPFKQVLDDDGHLFDRGVPLAVCGKTFRLLSGAPYGDAFHPLEPAQRIDPETAPPFACDGSIHRRETEGLVGRSTDPCATGCC